MKVIPTIANEPDVVLIGDVRATLAALLPLLDQKRDGEHCKHGHGLHTGAFPVFVNGMSDHRSWYFAREYSNR